MPVNKGRIVTLAGCAVAAPAAVAVWSGWVGLGTMCGFGIVHPLAGLWPSFKLDTTLTLPFGVEMYGAFALWVWSSPDVSAEAQAFAKRSSLSALALGMVGQVSYHLMAAAHWTAAPWPIVACVACLPVATLGLFTHLVQLVRAGQTQDTAEDMSEDTEGGDQPDNELDKRRRKRRRKGTRPRTYAPDIIALHKAEPGLSHDAIAVRIGCHVKTVQRTLGPDKTRTEGAA